MKWKPSMSFKLAQIARFRSYSLVEDLLNSIIFQSYVGASFHINENLTLVCERRKTVVDFLDGWHRVVTPQVMEKAHEHFNCAAIGGPLEGVKDVSEVDVFSC